MSLTPGTDQDHRQHCRRFLAFIFAISLILLPKTAKTAEVDLELLLAVDVSTSVDPVEAAQQRAGYINAFREPALQQTILDGVYGRIAVSYVEWAGAGYQKSVIGWTLIDSADAALSFADHLEAAPISSAPSTSISGLIDFARRAFVRNDYDGLRQVIDISGDGPNSAGRPAAAARDEAVAAGITINGLPVLSSRPDPVAGAPATGVERYYRRHVIGGPGAFLLNVAEFENFGPVVVRKLIREIQGSIPSAQLSIEQGAKEGQNQTRSHSGEKSKSQMR